MTSEIHVVSLPTAIAYLHHLVREGKREKKVVPLESGKVAVHLDITPAEADQFPSFLKDTERIYLVYGAKEEKK